MRRFMPVVVLAAVSSAVLAQTPATSSFEVASIKRNTSGDGFMAMRAAGGRLTMANNPILALIGRAYASDAPMLGR